ncbi:MAG: PmoA family protein [Verrucomicrobiae bacterium]|nr:PmoA family protein [Verrucomicrobiae bacterium]
MLGSTLGVGAVGSALPVPGAVGTVGGGDGTQATAELAWARDQESLRLTYGPRELLRYQLRKPARGGASVESGGYLHPVTTPAGTVVTEVGPADHRHHRGVFLGWVEMRGTDAADFWGWGEPAPTAGRRIENVTVEGLPPTLGVARFRATNAWKAGARRMVLEEVRVTLAFREGATVLDYVTRLTVDAPVTVARWAFGGFAVRTRIDGAVAPIGPEGAVRRASPRHTDPDSNWPDAPWYGLHLKFRDGKEATVAVAGREANPPTSWHVVPGIGLINPSVTAKGALRLVPEEPLVLRYRIMAFDGAPAVASLKRLGEGWYFGTS